jgi:hypothetical protein
VFGIGRAQAQQAEGVWVFFARGWRVGGIGREASGLAPGDDGDCNTTTAQLRQSQLAACRQCDARQADVVNLVHRGSNLRGQNAQRGKLVRRAEETHSWACTNGAAATWCGSLSVRWVGTLLHGLYVRLSVHTGGLSSAEGSWTRGEGRSPAADLQG